MKAIIAAMLVCLVVVADDLGNPSALARLSKASAGGGGGASFPQPGSVVYHYNLDEASGPRLATLGGVSLTEPAGEVVNDTGKRTNAANLAVLSDTRYLDAGEEIQPVGTAYTMSFWFRSTALPLTAAGLVGSYGPGLVYLTTAGEVHFTSVAGFSDFGFGSIGGSWNLIAVAHNGVDTAYASLNGANWTTVAGSATTGPYTFKVGLNSDAGFTTGNGAIDEITIWSTVVLSNSDLTNLWNSGTGTFYEP